MPWFSAKDIKQSRLTDSADHISRSVFDSTSIRKIPAGTVTMVVRGMILAHTVPIAILDVESAINQDLKALIPRREIDPRFLAAMLRAQHDVILAQVSTAAHGTKKLDARVLESIRIPLPPLDEQRRIAAILDQAGALRAKRSQLLAHLDEITHSVFDDMFGSHPWSATLADIADVQIGPFGSLLHQSDYVRGAVAVLNPMHIQGGVLQPDPEFSVSEEKAVGLARYRLCEGDIVLGRRGEMGRAGIVRPEQVGMLCGTGSLILRPKQSRSTFLHAVVTSTRMKRYLERHSLGATLPNLNAGIVKCSPVPNPSVELQRAFEEHLTAVARTRATTLEAVMVDAEFCTSLHSRAFRGEL